MVKYVKGKDGRFAGSIGDGKQVVPTMSDVPRHSTSAADSAAGASAVEKAHAAWQSTPAAVVTNATTEQAFFEAPAFTKAVLADFHATKESGWEVGLWTNRDGRTMERWTSNANPDVHVLFDQRTGERSILVGDNMNFPYTLIPTRKDGTAVSAQRFTAHNNYSRSHFNDDGQLSNTNERAAIVEVDNDEYVGHYFYRDGQYLGKQVWRTLYDADGKEVRDNLLNWRKQTKATGGLGEQPPGYRAF